MLCALQHLKPQTLNPRYFVQYGTHPSWSDGVNREERKRSRLVGTAVQHFTAKKTDAHQVLLKI